MSTTSAAIGELIASNARNTLGLGQMLLADIPADRFARLARGEGGGVIQSNHPAFVYGHLSMYPHRICEMLSAAPDAEAAKRVEQWAAIFGARAECRDDPGGTIYPPMEEITQAFISEHERVIDVAANAPDDIYLAENTSPTRDRLGLHTIGAVAVFMLTSHPMMHLGQVSAWRRMEGLGSVLRP